MFRSVLATAWRMARCTFAGADPPHFRQMTSGATSARRLDTVLEQHSHRECQSTRLAARFTACREASAHEASGGGRSQRRPSGLLFRPYCPLALLGGERVSGIRPRAEARSCGSSALLPSFGKDVDRITRWMGCPRVSSFRREGSLIRYKLPYLEGNDK